MQEGTILFVIGIPVQNISSHLMKIQLFPSIQLSNKFPDISTKKTILFDSNGIFILSPRFSE